MTNEQQSTPPVHREYAGNGIIVHWEPALCIHSGNCTRALAQVFDPIRRPWVDATSATADEIATAIQRCPSGALRYERTDGEPQEEPGEGVSIDPRPNGPLFLRGNVEVRDEAGNLLRRTTRAALCRCGGSANKPFCDNTHRTNGFQA
jgi:uncharacterized Fe-S cluster protein YjdI